MKKNLLIGAVMLGAASFSMLTGFDSSLTAEDILQKSQEAGNATTEVIGNADINVDVDLAVPAADMTIGIKGTGTEHVAATMDPLAMSCTADFAVSVLGQNLNVKVDIYGLMEEDGQFAVYAKPEMEGEEASEWTKTTVDGEKITEAVEKAKSHTLDLASLPFTYELDSQPAQVNGHECYKLSTTATWDELYLLAEPYLDELPDEVEVSKEELDSYSSLLSGLQFNLSTCVDTETFRPMSVHFDLNGSDWSTISALAGASFGTDEEGNPYEATLNVKASDIDILYDYETPVEIVLPEEAAAAQDVDSSSLLDMVENAEDAA